MASTRTTGFLAENTSSEGAELGCDVLERLPCQVALQAGQVVERADLREFGTAHRFLQLDHLGADVQRAPLLRGPGFRGEFERTEDHVVGVQGLADLIAVALVIGL